MQSVSLKVFSARGSGRTVAHLISSWSPNTFSSLPSRLGKPSAPLPTHWCFVTTSSSNLLAQTRTRDCKPSTSQSEDLKALSKVHLTRISVLTAPSRLIIETMKPHS